MENFKNKNEVKEEETKVEGEQIIVPTEEITSGAAEEMKKGDALDMEAAKTELQNFSAAEKAEAAAEKVELLSLAKEKLEEMKARAEKNSTSFMGKLFSGTNQLNVAYAAINEAMKKVNRGEIPNMRKVMESAKVDVDISKFPKNPNAVLSSGTSAGTSLMGNS